MKIYCFLLLLLFKGLHLHAVPIEKETYENLVFEGAGIRGIAYCGAIKELESQGMMASVKRVAGTSAGAITALLLSLGYKADEISAIIGTTNFRKFNDGNIWLFGGVYRFTKSYGWFRKQAFEKWLGKLIAQKTGDADITFQKMNQAGYKALYVTGTCLNRQKLIVFSAESYPHMKVLDAVAISMSIPLYFEASFIDQNGRVFKERKKPEGLDILVDGGLIANFPISIFDETNAPQESPSRKPNVHTIGFRIDEPRQIELDQADTSALMNVPINNFRNYVTALYIFTIENLNRHSLTPEDWKRTISISSEGIGPRIRKLSQTEKNTLIASGQKATRHFFDKKQ